MRRHKKSQVAWQPILLGAISIMIVVGLFAGVGSEVLQDIKADQSSTTQVVNETWAAGASTTPLQLTKDCLVTGSGIVVTNSTAGTATTVLSSGNYTVYLETDGDSFIFLNSASEFAGDPINITYSYHTDSWCIMHDGQDGIGNITGYLGLLGTIMVLAAIIVVLTSVFVVMRLKQ